MEWSFDSIFQYPPIIGVTINTVMLSPAFRKLLYILMAAVFVLVAVFYLIRNRGAIDALRRAVVSSFFAGGLLFAAHADIGWATWINADMIKYDGRTTEEKLILNDPGITQFVHAAKQIIPKNYTLFGTLDEYVVLRTEYLLLPLQKRKTSDYIIVMLDREARYDPANRTLTRGDAIIRNLDIVYQYAPEAYILRKGS